MGQRIKSSIRTEQRILLTTTRTASTRHRLAVSCGTSTRKLSASIVVHLELKIQTQAKFTAVNANITSIASGVTSSSKRLRRGLMTKVRASSDGFTSTIKHNARMLASLAAWRSTRRQGGTSGVRVNTYRTSSMRTPCGSPSQVCAPRSVGMKKRDRATSKSLVAIALVALATTTRVLSTQMVR